MFYSCISRNTFHVGEGNGKTDGSHSSQLRNSFHIGSLALEMFCRCTSLNTFHVGEGNGKTDGSHSPKLRNTFHVGSLALEMLRRCISRNTFHVGECKWKFDECHASQVRSAFRVGSSCLCLCIRNVVCLSVCLVALTYCDCLQFVARRFTLRDKVRECTIVVVISGVIRRAVLFTPNFVSAPRAAHIPTVFPSPPGAKSVIHFTQNV